MSKHYLEGLDTYGGNVHLQMVARERGFTAGAGFGPQIQIIAGWLTKQVDRMNDTIASFTPPPAPQPCALVEPPIDRIADKRLADLEDSLVRALERIAVLEKQASPPSNNFKKGGR